MNYYNNMEMNTNKMYNEVCRVNQLLLAHNLQLIENQKLVDEYKLLYDTTMNDTNNGSKLHPGFGFRCLDIDVDLLKYETLIKFYNKEKDSLYYIKTLFKNEPILWNIPGKFSEIQTDETRKK